MAPQTLDEIDIIDHDKETSCKCDHCEIIKDQQSESEKRWVMMHKLFDR
mgnify:CR=1 FL=1